MKLTRYFQSCLLVEEAGTRLLIDPSGQEAKDADKFGKLDAVIYTHEHADHFDADLTQKFMDGGVAVYANASTAKQMKSKPDVVTNGQEFSVKGLKITAKELPHCLMVGGTEGPQNTGYLIAEKLFHSGDGVSLEGLKADILAAPIAGPDVSFKDTHMFALQTSAKTLVPVHYDFIGVKPDVFAILAGWAEPPYEIKIIGAGETAEL